MGKTIRFNENGLIAIKKRLNEIMVGTPGVSHNDVCENVGEEFAPVTEIGMEQGGGPGLYAHKKEVDEDIDFDDNGMSINDDKILGKYNLKDLILSKTDNYVTLNKIVAKELGKGYGSKFMEELARVADKNGWILALTPDTTFGGSSVSRLKNFYKRFGFVPNKGRNTDFNTRESMIRKPIRENIEKEVESSEVDLSSFKKRDSLPPGIWKDEETLDSKVRLKLLDIADDFWEFVNLSWVEPKGIIITGSICNFNWSKFSDIDLHLIVDFSEIDSKTEFVKQYFDSKKNEWNTEHDGLKIIGFPVELYVQDINENPEAGGIYDLEENAWIRRPNPHTIKSIGLNKFNIKDKAAEIMTIIDDMYDTMSSTSDGHVLDQVGEDAHYLWDKVKNLRKKSLSKNGESGSGNIVYKVLRRTGYLDKLFKLFSTVYDRSNSITESVDVFSLAKERFGVTNDVRECGFILPDGSMLDFSGRHDMDAGADQTDIRGRRTVEHDDIRILNYEADKNTINGNNFSRKSFITDGAIRVSYSPTGWSNINLLIRPTNEQVKALGLFIRQSNGNVIVEIGDGDDSLSYGEYDNASYRLVIGQILRYFDEGVNLMGNITESMRKYLTVLKEEVAVDGSTEDNPYEERWKAERKALKDFVANYGKLMQSREDNKGGKLYKVYYDETMSKLIGYNYCICVQWNEQEMKPGTTVYIRALDKFTPFIRRNLQFDTRGRDNMRGTYDDTGY